MSKIALSGDASGTGTFTIASPNSNSNYTLTLPQATTTVVGTDATQTLTNKTWASPASSTISSATAQASTSGTSIDFTGIPSWVKRITVAIQGLSFAASSGQARVQIGTGGSLTASGYTSDSLVVTGNATCNTSNFTNGLSIFNGNVAGDTLWGVTTITQLSGNLWVSSFTSCRSDGTASRTGTGYIMLSGVLDIVGVVATTGSFDAGTINILYE